jgi:hypothetical protein
MTPHAEILSVIAAEFPKWVPVGYCIESDDFLIAIGEPREIQDRNNAIEKAAWGVVRWWCKRQPGRGGMLVDDEAIGEMCLGILYIEPESDVVIELGSGPTDADALLAALKYIAGEMGKEKK